MFQKRQVVKKISLVVYISVLFIFHETVMSEFSLIICGFFDQHRVPHIRMNNVQVTVRTQELYGSSVNSGPAQIHVIHGIYPFRKNNILLVIVQSTFTNSVC